MTDDARKVAIARLVAKAWSEAAINWGSLQMDGRMTAHPLCLVIAALDGETDPIRLGISPTDTAFEAIRMIRRLPRS